MTRKNGTARGFKFDDWQVFPNLNVIIRDGVETAIEPKMMAVLVLLAANSGNTVERDAVMADVWKGYVVTDDVLSRIISLLRSALGDSSRHPKYIQTIPKKGYLFIAEITPIEKSVKGNLPFFSSLSFSKMTISFIVLLVSIACLSYYSNIFHNTNFVDRPTLAPFKELSAPQTKTSIAVLPFQRDKGDVFQQFLSDGLFDELITVLPSISGLKVVSRKSSYLQSEEKIASSNASSMTNIDLVLDGNISQKLGKHVFEMQLTALKTGELVWSAVYTSEQVNQYDIQRSVIAIVTAAIQEFIGNDAFNIANTIAPNPEAYQLYIRGKQQFKLRGEKPLRESVSLFNEAIAIDPSFQKLYISLAEAYSVLPFYSSMPAKKGYTLALDTLAKLDPKDNNLLADAIAVKAQIATRRWEWAKAEKLFQEAFSLSTQNANTYMWYSEFLSAVGRLADSSQAAIYSKELDGISAVVNNRLAVTFLWMDDIQQAEKYFGQGYEFGFINYTNPGYAIFLIRQQKFISAEQVLGLILSSGGASTDWVEPVIASIDDAEKRPFAVESFQRAVNNLQVPPRFQPPIWIFLKEYKQAADSFDQLIQNRYDLDIEFLFSSEATEFRTTQEFQRLISNIGLQQYWQDNAAPDYKTIIN